jgi:hypothetical protein
MHAHSTNLLSLSVTGEYGVEACDAHAAKTAKLGAASFEAVQSGT